MHPNVHCSVVYNSQDMEATKVSIKRWMFKEDVVFIYNGVLATKNAILPFATAWMDLEVLMLAEISPIDKDKYCYVFILYMEYKK